MLIKPDNASISIARQCELVGLSRSSWYYQPLPESDLNLTLMRLIDEQYLTTPFYGYPQMTRFLRRQGYTVNPKRVYRLMRKMRIQAVFPRPNTSKRAKDHPVYPYLLRGMTIERPNQVWSTDITYIPLAKGFMYLVAIIDWYSRYILAWELSNTLDKSFCIKTLNRSLSINQPEVFNSDQGSQFTSPSFTSILTDANIRISMDGRGRALDNIFIERFWRTIKYEEIYLHAYDSVYQLVKRLEWYFNFYNEVRPHSSLNGATPAEIYFNRVAPSEVVGSRPLPITICS